MIIIHIKAKIKVKKLFEYNVYLPISHSISIEKEFLQT